MRRRALVAGLVAMGLGAASAQAPPAGTSPAEQEEQAVQEQQVEVPAVVAQAEEEGSSESAGKRPRDPFRPFTLDLRPADIDEPLTPLQRYELAQLRVSAVLLNITPPRALLEDNSGMGFIVTPGTPIGRRRGVVAAIEPRTVIVEERALDFYGQEKMNRVAMEMIKESDVQGGTQE